MNKEQHNHLLYKIIAIERMMSNPRYTKKAQQETLKILARLVTEIYEIQHEK